MHKIKKHNEYQTANSPYLILVIEQFGSCPSTYHKAHCNNLTTVRIIWMIYIHLNLIKVPITIQFIHEIKFDVFFSFFFPFFCLFIFLVIYKISL